MALINKDKVLHLQIIAIQNKTVFFLANILYVKYSLKTSVIKAGFENQWKISIKKKSMAHLVSLVSKHIVP